MSHRTLNEVNYTHHDRHPDDQVWLENHMTSTPKRRYKNDMTWGLYGDRP